MRLTCQKNLDPIYLKTFGPNNNKNILKQNILKTKHKMYTEKHILWTTSQNLDIKMGGTEGTNILDTIMLLIKCAGGCNE